MKKVTTKKLIKEKPIVTALVGTNADLFGNAVSLYLNDGDRVLDMTYGKGVFWRNIDETRFDLIRNDLDLTLGDYHDDLRCTRWQDQEFDAVVLDPPYSGRSGSKVTSALDRSYNVQAFALEHGVVGVKDTLEFYQEGIIEAIRLLKPGGLLFIKVMDIVWSGKQHRLHIDVFNYAIELGLIDEDLFTLVQKNPPTMRHNYQLHARKNNSFLWVFRKKG